MINNRYKLYCAVIALFCLCGIAVAVQPNKFQKWNSIKSIQESKYNRELGSSNVIELEFFLNNIPYKDKSDYVYSVYPEAKYSKTILNGYGDCSTMSFGASYYLLKNKIDFELIHFLPQKSLFTGGGHVTLRVPYNFSGKNSTGILDLAGGGLPSYEGKYLDVFDLKKVNGPIDFIRVNKNAPEYYKNYYKKDYLNDVYLGFTPSREVYRYFSFIDKYYFSIGNEKLEKLIFDGLAIVSGKYYTIYVDNEFIINNKSEIIIFKLVLYLIRVLLVIIPVCLTFEVLKKYLKNKTEIN